VDDGCVTSETCSTHRKVEKPKMLVGKSGRKRPYVGPDVDGRIIPYIGADKSLARPTSRCILFDGENISFDASLVIYV